MSVKYNYLGTNEKTNYFKSSWRSAQARHTITKIVGHDFAGGETLTAKAGAKLISDRMDSNGDSANVHWIVDANEVYAVIPESQSAYSTGVASYNQSTLNIEIAPSFTKGTETKFSSEANKENYRKAWQTMCKLMADICVKYDLDENDIMQHNQIKSTACPYTMKVYFGSYAKALSETKEQVKKEIETLKGDNVKKEEYYYFKFSKFPWPHNVISRGGAQDKAIGVLECTKDTYLYNDFEAHSQRQKCPKTKDGKPMMFPTCGNMGKGYNKKGYYMHKVIFDSCVVWVCYKKKK